LSPSSAPAINSTPTVLWLIGIITGIHLLRLVLPPDLELALLVLGGFSPGDFVLALFDPQAQYSALILATPLSHALLHADIFHLAINMAFLLAFGTAVDRRIGSVRFLVLFFVCVLGGALLSTLVQFGAPRPVLIIGASGGISGLLGAYFRFGIRRLLLPIVVFIGINLVLATGLVSYGGAGGIAWEAHIGGFLAGFLLFPLFQHRPRLVGR